jgi:hypothetical protein
MPVVEVTSKAQDLRAERKRGGREAVLTALTLLGTAVISEPLLGVLLRHSNEPDGCAGSSSEAGWGRSGSRRSLGCSPSTTSSDSRDSLGTSF